MAINSTLMDNLGNGDLRHDEDFPHTNRIFRHLERAGIGPDQVSHRTLMRCARLAIQEVDLERKMPPTVALDLYTHVHDAVMGNGALPSNEVVTPDIATDSQ